MYIVKKKISGGEYYYIRQSVREGDKVKSKPIGNPGKTILVVSHGGVMRYLLIHLGFGTYTNLPTGSIGNTAYIKLETDGVDFFVKETKGITKKEI